MIGYSYKQNIIKLSKASDKMKVLKKDNPIPKDTHPMPDKFSISWK